MEICKIRRANPADRVPVLREFFGLIRLEPGKIGLVIRVGTCHQLGILAVGVGQGVLPRFCELIIGPCEHLLARRDMMVADVDDAAAKAVVVSAEEVIFGGAGEI